jgi:multicomponent Na+:H+ antiporter subunit F
VAAALVVIRLMLGPTTADRVVAVDTLLLVMVAGLTVQLAYTRETRFIWLILGVSMLGFVATTAAARFLERRFEGEAAARMSRRRKRTSPRRHRRRR